jgi:TRAP-type C4-dicarboxylate transport system permease small subunit
VFAKALTAAPRALAGLLIGLITVLLAVAVFGRYTGFYSVIWAEEAARAMFIWMVLLGAAAAVERGGHFRLDILEKVLPRPVGRFFSMFAHLAMVALGLALLATGIQMVANSAGQFTNALGMPQSAVNAAIPAGGALFVWFGLRNVYRMAVGRAGA